MSGKPKSLFLDNAAEFKGEALRRGCEQHGIRLSYRPPGQPHYGGIVERVTGTAMGKIHELPGTTFSNPGERGTYDSEKMVALTLPELEKWMVLAVASCHGSRHGTLGQTPAAMWAAGVVATGIPAVTANQTSFLVDFLPVVRRTLTRTGFVIDSAAEKEFKGRCIRQNQPPNRTSQAVGNDHSCPRSGEAAK